MKKIIAAILVLLLIAGGIAGYIFYKKIFAPKVRIAEGQEPYFYIPTGSEFDDVVTLLAEQNFVEDTASFRFVAEKMNYPSHIYPGRYRLKNKMSNRALVRLLRSGEQEPLRLTIHGTDTREGLASLVGKKLEADSAAVVQMLNDSAYLAKYDVKPEAALTLILPNTYEFFWDTDAKEFLDRMGKEYDRFWTPERKVKAGNLNLSPTEVIILASIVEKETTKKEETATIAGVYLNRLQRGWLLQADPTVKYAMKLKMKEDSRQINELVGKDSVQVDTLRRIWGKYTEIESPYNTYRTKGLPPGPISLPSITTIEAVLNAQDHRFMYFCAKEDFSGYHYFTKTYDEHLACARKYRKALNERKIR